MSAFLTVRDLTVAYANVTAVHSVSFEVPKNGFLALLGPNGAGKTSLLNAISGLVPARRGTVTVGGTALSGLSAHQVARRGLRLVPENRSLFPDMSVLENLYVGAGRLPRAERAARVERAYALFPRLEERGDQRAGTMSGGEQQMLSIARALVADPDVLLLDEPSMGLAPMVVSAIMAAVGQLREQGLTIVVAEQNARAVLPVVDSAVLMSHGQLVMAGSADEVGRRIEADGYLGA